MQQRTDSDGQRSYRPRKVRKICVDYEEECLIEKPSRQRLPYARRYSKKLRKRSQVQHFVDVLRFIGLRFELHDNFFYILEWENCLRREPLEVNFQYILYLDLS